MGDLDRFFANPALRAPDAPWPQTSSGQRFEPRIRRNGIDLVGSTVFDPSGRIDVERGEGDVRPAENEDRDRLMRLLAARGRRDADMPMPRRSPEPEGQLLGNPRNFEVSNEDYAPLTRRDSEPEGQLFGNQRNFDVSNEDYFGPPSQVAAGAADVGRDLPDLSALAASLLAGGPAADRAPAVPEGWRTTPGRIPQEDLNTFANALGLDNEMKGLVSRQWDNAHSRAVTEGVQTARATLAKRIADAQLEAIKAREASNYARTVKVGNRSVTENDHRLALRRANPNEDPTDMFSYLNEREPGLKAEMPKAPMGGSGYKARVFNRNGDPVTLTDPAQASEHGLDIANKILNDAEASPEKKASAKAYKAVYERAKGRVPAEYVTRLASANPKYRIGAVGITTEEVDAAEKKRVDDAKLAGDDVDRVTRAIHVGLPKGGSQSQSLLDRLAKGAASAESQDLLKAGKNAYVNDSGTMWELQRRPDGGVNAKPPGGEWVDLGGVKVGGSVPAPAAPAPAPVAPTAPPAKDPNRHSNVPAVDGKTTGSIRPIEPTPSPNVREFGVKLQQIAASDAPRVEKLKQLAIFKKRYGVTDEDIAQLKSQMTA